MLHDRSASWRNHGSLAVSFDALNTQFAEQAHIATMVWHFSRYAPGRAGSVSRGPLSNRTCGFPAYGLLMVRSFTRGHLGNPIPSFNKLRSHLANCHFRVGPPSSGGPTGDLFSYQVSLRRQPGQERIEQLVIQMQSVGDLIGFDDDLIGFRGRVVCQVLQILGDRTMIQVNVVQAIDDPSRDGRRRPQPAPPPTVHCGLA
jgi:hypothetical protein